MDCVFDLIFSAKIANGSIWVNFHGNKFVFNFYSNVILFWRYLCYIKIMITIMNLTREKINKFFVNDILPSSDCLILLNYTMMGG